MKVKIGDMVVYRDWQKGDRPLEETPEIERGWGDFGIVFWAGQDKFGSPYPEPAVSFLNQHSEFIRAAQKDVEVISGGR